jgi:hypothetical protein
VYVCSVYYISVFLPNLFFKQSHSYCFCHFLVRFILFLDFVSSTLNNISAALWPHRQKKLILPRNMINWLESHFGLSKRQLLSCLMLTAFVVSLLGVNSMGERRPQGIEFLITLWTFFFYFDFVGTLLPLLYYGDCGVESW